MITALLEASLFLGVPSLALIAGLYYTSRCNTLRAMPPTLPAPAPPPAAAVAKNVERIVIHGRPGHEQSAIHGNEVQVFGYITGPAGNVVGYQVHLKDGRSIDFYGCAIEIHFSAPSRVLRPR